MSVVRTFPVPALGVGRVDYSVQAELHVEPLVRSHLHRCQWTVEALLPTLAYPDANLALFVFMDAAHIPLFYVPNDMKYIIYKLSCTGNYNSLTFAYLARFTWPALNFVEAIVEAYGYGKATARIINGHVCVPGFAYGGSINLWSEKAAYTASLVAHGMADERVD